MTEPTAEQRQAAATQIDTLTIALWRMCASKSAGTAAAAAMNIVATSAAIFPPQHPARLSIAAALRVIADQLEQEPPNVAH